VVLVGVLLLRADGPVAFASRARLSRVAVPVVLGLVLFLLVGSRLLLSWHWLSDLVGGALLGVALAGASLRVASADAAEPRPAS
jgi:membrane-associated phospholipid phosphatase